MNKKPSLLEQNVIAYHRRMLKNNTYGRDQQGNITTFRGALIGDKENNGPTQLVPTWWNGRLLNSLDEIENARKEALKQGIKWPIYKSYKEAEQREQKIHSDYMDKDIRSGSYKKGIKLIEK